MKNLMIVIATVLLTTAGLHAQESHFFTNEEGVVLKGYDVVSYFENDEPVKGKQRYSVEHDGGTFYFANRANKRAFKKNPEQYLPKYGGYCAFAMGAKAKKVPSDPNTYEIENGNLYLFFNGKMKGKRMNTIHPWNKKQEMLQPKAEQNWSKMNN